MMKKNWTIAILFCVLSARIYAAEPTYTFKPKNETTLPYSLSGFKKQKAETPQNAIKIKILPLIFNMASFQYERVVNEKISFACDLNYLFYSTTTNGNNIGSGNTSSKVTFTGFGISPELRFYPGEEALKGFFIGPYLNYLTMNVKVESTEANGLTGIGELKGISALGAGALLGWKWLVAESFSIEAHAGLNFLSVNIPTTVGVKYSDGTSKTEDGPNLSASGLLPTLGLSLGYAF